MSLVSERHDAFSTATAIAASAELHDAIMALSRGLHKIDLTERDRRALKRCSSYLVDLKAAQIATETPAGGDVPNSGGVRVLSNIDQTNEAVLSLVKGQPVADQMSALSDLREFLLESAESRRSNRSSELNSRWMRRTGSSAF